MYQHGVMQIGRNGEVESQDTALGDRLPDLVDAWGQPILYLRAVRSVGNLVGEAGGSSAPRTQFVLDPILPYLNSDSLGELGKPQGDSIIRLANGNNRSRTVAQIIRHPGLGNPTLPAALRVTIEPEAARNAGAGWQLVPESTLRPSGAQKSGLAPGSYTLRFTSVTGFPAPADQTVVVSGGQLTNITVSYAVETTDLEVWRFDHFGTISNAGDAADDADPDNDNQTNIEEYAAGTNPNDPKDVFKVVSTSLTGGTFTATVAGKAGRTYILQRRANLSSGSWSNVRIVGPLPGDATTSLGDSAAPAGSAFYQIVVTFP